jgi:hypothetical protein
MIVCATPLVPLEWRVDGSAWAVIIPLAYVDSNPSKHAHLILFCQCCRWVPYPLSGKSPSSLTECNDGCLLCQIGRPQSVVDDFLLLSERDTQMIDDR